MYPFFYICFFFFFTSFLYKIQEIASLKQKKVWKEKYIAKMNFELYIFVIRDFFFLHFTYYQQSLSSVANIDTFPVKFNAPCIVIRFQLFPRTLVVEEETVH